MFRPTHGRFMGLTWLDGGNSSIHWPKFFSAITFRPGFAATVSSSDPATMQCHLNTSFTGNAPECKAKDHFLDPASVKDWGKLGKDFGITGITNDLP